MYAAITRWQVQYVALSPRARIILQAMYYGAILFAIYALNYIHPLPQLAEVRDFVFSMNPQSAHFVADPYMPFGELSYLWIFVPLVISTAAVSIFARPWLTRYWVTSVTAAMIFLNHGGERIFIPSILANQYLIIFWFALIEWLLVRLFLTLRQSWIAYAAAITCAGAPYLILKFIPSGHGPLFFIGLLMVSYRIVDVIFTIRDGLISELRFSEYFTYILFFATLPMGPVDRYRRFVADLRRERTLADFLSDARTGVAQIFKGLLYRQIISNLFVFYVLAQLSTSTTLAGILLYSFLILFWQFFLIAGRSAYAIGVSHIFGIYTPENFYRNPFLSTNYQEFWNRWNVSLSWWYRDHFYSRFVYTALKRKWRIDPQLVSYLGYILTFGLVAIIQSDDLESILFAAAYSPLLMIGYKVYSLNRHRFAPILDPIPLRMRQVGAIALTLMLASLGSQQLHLAGYLLS